MAYCIEYLRRTVPRVLKEEVRDSYLSDSYLIGCMKLLHGRVSTLRQMISFAPYMWTEPKFDLPPEKWDDLKAQICDELAGLQSSVFSERSISDAICAIADSNRLSIPFVLGVVRLATTGTKSGPSLIPTLSLLGYDRVIANLSKFHTLSL